MNPQLAQTWRSTLAMAKNPMGMYAPIALDSGHARRITWTSSDPHFGHFVTP
jgi:hypothetical protein